MSSPKFYNGFIDNALKIEGLCIKVIDQLTMQVRLDEIMIFVNNIRAEFSKTYGWQREEKDYFLNPLNKKFTYSFLIETIETNEICFINFTSVYDTILHSHGTYVKERYRNQNLAKYHMLKICTKALEDGYEMQDGYWPKQNNGSIILHLKMGWKIEDIRKNGTQLYMIANNMEVRNRVFEMLTTSNR